MFPQGFLCALPSLCVSALKNLELFLGGGRDDFEEGDLRRRKNPHRRPPGPGAATGVEMPAAVEGVETVLQRIFQGGEEIEGEDLAAVGVAGELEVEEAESLSIEARAGA